MNKINEIPTGSLLMDYGWDYDYLDSFCVQLERDNVESWEPVVAFFHCSPAWVNGLMRVRNYIVNLLGLKARFPNLDEIKPPLEIGQSFGSFRLFELHPQESLMGTDAFHLNFRLSLFVDQNNVLHATTGIVFNNITGKIYLVIVKPFHRFIVPYMLKKMATNINNNVAPPSAAIEAELRT